MLLWLLLIGDTIIPRSREFNPAPILELTQTASLQTPSDAVYFMEGMQEALPQAGYDHLVPFNDIYLQLTQRVIRAIADGQFRDSDTAQRAIPDFCERYRTPTHDFVTGNGSAVPRQWHRTLDPRMQRANPAIRFAGGMISHIQVDLPYTVAKLGAPEGYYEDYTALIGDLIADTAHDLAPRYLPVRGLARRHMVDHVVSRIADWRESAWHDGVRLMRADNDPAAQAEIGRELNTAGARTGWIYRYPGNVALTALGVLMPARVDDLTRAA